MNFLYVSIGPVPLSMPLIFKLHAWVCFGYLSYKNHIVWDVLIQSHRLNGCVYYIYLYHDYWHFWSDFSCFILHFLFNILFPWSFFPSPAFYWVNKDFYGPFSPSTGLEVTDCNSTLGVTFNCWNTYCDRDWLTVHKTYCPSQLGTQLNYLCQPPLKLGR